jgi:hypothetical protein
MGGSRGGWLATGHNLAFTLEGSEPNCDWLALDPL